MMRECHHQIGQREADHLVDRIVTTDILTYRDHRAVQRENRGAVEPSSRGEYALAGAEFLRQCEQNGRRHSRRIRGRRNAAANRVDAGLAAYAAARAHHEVALEARAESVGRHVQHDVDGVGLGRALAPAHASNLAELARVVDKAFGKKKSRSELFVVAGRAHRKREAAACESNLQRLFDREPLDAFGSLGAMPSERVMLANFVADSVALSRKEVAVSGTRRHPSPTSSALGTDSVAMRETASRTSSLK